MRKNLRHDFNRKFMWGIMAMAIVVIVLVLLFAEWAFQNAAN